MSDPTDIKALEEYLKRGSEVSQRYREIGGEQVPPELDRRVLAAAREAVGNEGSKRSRSWLRFSAPVALAASVVLVLTVVLESGPDKDTPVPAQAPADTNQAELAKRTDELARHRDAGRVVPVVPVPVEEARALHADVPPTPEPSVVDVRQQLREVAPPQVKLEQQPASTAVANVAARKSLDRGEAEADTSERRMVGPSTAMSSRAAGLEAVRAPASPAQAQRADPEAWLKDIRELRRAGKSEEADREWQYFREAFPDFHVADDDIARKQP